MASTYPYIDVAVIGDNAIDVHGPRFLARVKKSEPRLKNPTTKY